jgi:hypothetical protein
MSLNFQSVHVARTGRRIVATRTLGQRDVMVEQPGLVERVLELHDGAQVGCFGHFEADAALNVGMRKGSTCLPLDGMVMGVGGLILVYEPEIGVWAPVDNDCVAHAHFFQMTGQKGSR